ncbi:MAG TPA: endonuclease/exonuclease/phosphatase family protein [Kiloniellales bacterium]
MTTGPIEALVRMLDRPTSDKPTSVELIESRLRVVTWNLWWRYGPWERRRPAIEATLGSLDADVIALQEVWDDGVANMAAGLGQVMAYHHVYRSAEKRNGIGFGNAILSRWPIARTDWRPLPGDQESGEGRCVLFAELDGPNGPIQVFVTHLNWRFDHSHIRQQQVREIARFVASKRPRSYPPIVCGDFNAEPASEEIRMMTGLATCPVERVVFRDAWRDGGDGSGGYTWDNHNGFAHAELEPDRRIDYIFVGWPKDRGAGHVVSCRLAGNEPVGGVWPSDHFAVVADLRY